MSFSTPRVGSRLTRIVATIGLVAGVTALGAPSASATNVSSISTGAVHVCVRTASGGAKCWGYNEVGMVGDGTKIDRHKPVNVQGLGSGVADVQAVWDHSCALTTGGGVKCWGHNGDGELGDGTLLKRPSPVNVDGLNNGVQQVSLGFDSGCALLNTGAVRCWGYNGNGQLGDGTRSTRRTSVKVDGINTAVAISAGWDHTCAVLTGGALVCWGGNDQGEIGDGTRHDRLKAVPVSGLGSGVAAVSAGFDHTCALLTGGGVMCWGNNRNGELGDGTTTNRLTPQPVNGLGSGVGSISAGFNHTCAVTTGGAAKCWGANESGELGDGTTKDRNHPVGVYRASSGIDSISAGGFRNAGLTCLITNQGAARCFGANHGVSGLEPIDSHGYQMGDGTKIERHIPITVRGLTGLGAPNFRPDALISKSATSGFRQRRLQQDRREADQDLGDEPGQHAALLHPRAERLRGDRLVLRAGRGKRSGLRRQVRNGRQEHQGARHLGRVLVHAVARSQQDDRHDGPRQEQRQRRCQAEDEAAGALGRRQREDRHGPADREGLTQALRRSTRPGASPRAASRV
jgi:hypothetical protein